MYRRNVSEKSVIFIEDYKSMEDLADHLDYLDENDTAYLEYFQWRKTDLSKTPTKSVNNQMWLSVPACSLCTAIHENIGQEKKKCEKHLQLDL